MRRLPSQGALLRVAWLRTTCERAAQQQLQQHQQPAWRAALHSYAGARWAAQYAARSSAGPSTSSSCGGDAARVALWAPLRRWLATESAAAAHARKQGIKPGGRDIDYQSPARR
ncbi:hypothetical protein MNEG_13806, partial [Monoraphidium neglectum]